MIIGLRTVIYPAPDRSIARSWYEQVLQRPPRFDEPIYVGLSVGGFEPGPVPDGQPCITGPQALGGVADVAAAPARQVDFGATVLDPVTDVGGGIRVAVVRDPLGNRFGILDNPYFKAAEVQ